MQSRMLRVNPGDARRKRQIILLLSAILIPTAVLITLATRLARQEAELAEKRVADQRRDALDQLRRELAARLETIKLQELNRLSNDSLSGESSEIDSPVVFVAPLIQNRLMLPWQTAPRSNVLSAAFDQYRKEGEAREFLGNDPTGAFEAYSQAVAVARSPFERCTAMLAKGR